MAIISRSTFMMGLQGEDDSLSVVAGGPPWTGHFIIFEVRNVSSQSAGSTFTLDSGPIFQKTVDYLTNGQQGLISFIHWAASGFGRWKSDFNGGYPAIDLRGFTIEGLDLRIDSHTPWIDPAPGPAVTFTFIIRGKFPWGPLWWLYWPRLSLYRPQ